MKTSVCLIPTQYGVDSFEEFSTAAAISEIALTAEHAGFDAVYVTEHPAPSRAETGGHHAPDPFVTLAVAAAATTTLRLQTHITVAGYRNPFLLAKAVSTLDAASDGRVILGIGAGYLQAEFAALGVDFERRNELADEAVDLLPRIWSGEPVTFTSERFAARESWALPRPRQRPHPPIWIGGNSERAIRRAAQFGQAWVPFPNPAGERRVARTASLLTIERVRQRIALLHEHAERAGRNEPIDVAFSAGFSAMWEQRTPDSDEIISNASLLADAGVTHLIAEVGGRTRGEFLDALTRYGAEVLPTTTTL